MLKDFVPTNNWAKNCNPYFCILKVGAVTFVIIDLIIFTQKDPSGYNSTLDEWYNHPDFPFFQTFFSKRLMRPDEEAHLLNPSSLWSIW